jgi:hypothetical protein
MAWIVLSFLPRGVASCSTTITLEHRAMNAD